MKRDCQYWWAGPFALLLFLCVLYAPLARGQFLLKPNSPKIEAHNSLLACYLFSSQPMAERTVVPFVKADATTEPPGHKSAFLAATLSLVIPGLGEYYVGDHVWRGMIFTSLEAGLWFGMIHWQNEYTADQNAFYAYSDEHFCDARYARHIDTLLVSDSVSSFAHVQDCDWRNVSRADWNSMNQAENAIDSLSNSNPGIGDWNHRIINPNDDMQQYYEEISKYDQFLPGWDQISSWSTASCMRATAQHEDDISRNFLFGIFLNHALSAIDAALLAHDHDTRIDMHGSLLLRPYPDGTMGMIPTANIQYRF